MYNSRNRTMITLIVIAVVMGCIFYLGIHLSKAKEQDWLQQSTLLSTTVTQEQEQTSHLSIYDKMKQGKVIRYLVIGDSIGQSDGATEGKHWFNLLNKKLKTEYHVVPFMERITMGGSVVLAGWIDYIEQIRKKPDGYDMIMICYGQNDQGSLTMDEFGSLYENLIRRIKQDYPNAEIITLVESSLRSDGYPNVIKSLSQHYGLINVDTRLSFEKSKLPYDQLTIDGVHPNNEGYQLYAQQIYDSLSQQYDENKQISELGDNLLYPNSSFTSGQTLHDWQSINGFVKNGNALTGNKPESTAENEFEGEFVALSYMTDPNGGVINVYVDGKLQRQINTNLKFAVNWKSIVVSGLKKGKHHLKIEIAPEDAKLSKGTFVHILGYITN